MSYNSDDVRQAVLAQILAEINTGGGGGARAVKAKQRARQESDDGFDSISSGMTPEDWDYLVDIERRDVMSPEGEKIGWDKKVHRYASPKGKEPPKGKKPKGRS